MAMKYTDSQPPEESRNTPWHSRPLGHEMMAFLVNARERSIEWSIDMRTVSRSGVPSTYSLLECTPRELIKYTICGVFDIANDDSYEIILYNESAGFGSFMIYRLQDGELITISSWFKGRI